MELKCAACTSHAVVVVVAAVVVAVTAEQRPFGVCHFCAF